MIVRDETPDDLTIIHALVETAFGRRDEALLVDRLRAAGDSVMSLIAVEDASIVGHAMFSRMAAPFPSLCLAPVAVRPDRRRRGIGTALIRRGLERASDGPWRAVFVLGDPAYYRRWGFDAGLAAGFDSPYAGPSLMVLPLGGGLPATRGSLAHAAAFSSLS